MKNLIQKTLSVTLLLIALATGSSFASGGTQVLVEGMTCSGCANSVKESLLKHTEVKAVEVNVKKGEVTITFQPEKTLNEEQIRAAVKDAGYKVTKVSAATKAS